MSGQSDTSASRAVRRFVGRSLGALTGNQAIQQVQVGLQVIFASGWQVAADANEAGEMYPDQSLSSERASGHWGLA
jgi:isocitrate lyase